MAQKSEACDLDLILDSCKPVNVLERAKRLFLAVV